MIHFHIIESPDCDVREEYKFFQNQIYLGKKDGNLLIKDPQILDSHLMIEIIEDQLIVHPQKGIDYYLIDGKRATTIRKIKRQQKITIGKTSIKILDFAETPFPSKKIILDDKLEELAKENSPRMEVIEKLAQLMK
jgi:hypothetical protein